MTLQLYHIDDGNCKFITKLMPSIFAVAQMEQEFYPYLTIFYMTPKEGQPRGIILRTKHGDIRRNYTFDNKTDIIELRKLIWDELLKEGKIHPVDISQANNPLSKPNNKVIQSWQAKKRQLDKEKCCKLVLDNLTPQIVKLNVKHEVFRLSNEDKQDKTICKKVRIQDCADNFPKGSAAFKRCVMETSWLCEHGYPNTTVNKADKYINTIRRNLYNYLKDNNMKVNKRKFDEIIDAGLFSDLGNRMGNKVADDKNVRAALDTIFTEKDYYLSLIEGYDDNNWNNFFGVVLIFLILAFVYIILKNNQ